MITSLRLIITPYNTHLRQLEAITTPPAPSQGSTRDLALLAAALGLGFHVLQLCLKGRPVSRRNAEAFVGWWRERARPGPIPSHVAHVDEHVVDDLVGAGGPGSVLGAGLGLEPEGLG